jgi:AcrR family transcriptional regulator
MTSAGVNHEGALREAIIKAAEKLLAAGGLTGCTVEAIADFAGCAKGLVNYHFRSKTALLRIVGERLRDARAEARIAALAMGGAEGLNALWTNLNWEVNSGELVAWLSLLAHPPTAEAVRPTSLQHAELGTALGVALASEGSVDPYLASAVLDAFQLLLLGGVKEPVVREGYDRFWLALLS